MRQISTLTLYVLVSYSSPEPKHKPLESINHVSGTEVTMSEIAAQEESKRISKSVQPKASLLGSWIGAQVFHAML